MSIQYQLRESPSVHYIIDVIQAAKSQLPENERTKEERDALHRCSMWIHDLLKLEQYRNDEINKSALSLLGPNKGIINPDFIRIVWATHKINNLDSRIMSIASSPSMSRIISVGTEHLSKNPNLETWRERQHKQNRQDYQVMLIKGK